MAQHDMNIANQGFPATRADLNNALQAIATNNSGTSAPSTTFANQWFYNTSSNKLFIRNEANSAFIEVATLDQTNNEWQITTGVIQAKDGDGLALKTDDGNTRLFVKDSNGFIGINTAGPSFPLHVDGTMKCVGTNNLPALVVDGNSTEEGDICVLDGQVLAIGHHALDGGATSFTERLRMSSTGKFGINDQSPDRHLHVNGGTENVVAKFESTDTACSIEFKDTTGTVTLETRNDFRFKTGSDIDMIIEGDQIGIGVSGTNAASGFSNQLEIGSTNGGMLILTDTNTTSNKRRHFISHPSTSLRFGRMNDDGSIISDIDMRISDGGDVLMGTGSTSVAGNTNAGEGFRYDPGGIVVQVQSNGHAAAAFNRSQDGDVIELRSAGVKEGAISISGSTTSYNSFSASHWSRLTDNSKPTILKGTIIETIDEMMDWYKVTFTIPELVKTDDDGNPVADANGNPMIEREEATAVEEIALPSGKSVGDTIDHVYSDTGETFKATIEKSGDNKHTKCKISDTADSTRIYGVFADWDNDLDDVNDFYVTAVGTHVVRIHSGQTVNAGDLLVSNGDGTAKVQDDDIIRSKTLGKVLTNIKQETYDDGSYTVPCALYCG